MKSETFASIKYVLAVMGLALLAAGKVLSDHSANIDVMDDELPDTDGVSAPTATAEITTAEIADAPRDKTGLPWDARIHSGNKTINADGTWKKRKGVSDAIVDAVTAELRATVGTAAPAPAAVTTAPAVTTPAVIPPPPAVVQIAVPALAPVSNDYTKLCDFLAKNSGEGTSLPDAWVTQFFAANSTSLPALATDQDKAGKLLEAMREALRGANVAEVA